ncbi:hypothetical protein VTN02DRAFT_3859 [Thermoascus thermophilus]
MPRACLVCRGGLESYTDGVRAALVASKAGISDTGSICPICPSWRCRAVKDGDPSPCQRPYFPRAMLSPHATSLQAARDPLMADLRRTDVLSDTPPHEDITSPGWLHPACLRVGPCGHVERARRTTWCLFSWLCGRTWVLQGTFHRLKMAMRQLKSGTTCVVEKLGQ